MKNSIEELISSNNDSQLSDTDKDKINKEFLELLTDDTIKSYFRIVSCYMDARVNRNLLISDVAEKSGLPEMTIKRFENLQTIPKILTLLKILRSVGLDLNIIASNTVDNQSEVSE